ncbi:PKD domain-containing protein [Archaeoglobus neptunius]|uniref:PKD domain-containing protein n=1 Tax=Archaeoglobus neptunius TaxID=2798580 RepID=UPI001928BCA2|nr:PKD domain-containing protein [Archaeoglobus neptunius]
MRWSLILLFLVFLLPHASALTLTVSGGCLNNQVTVTTDEKATIIFRMNGGTPVFSESSPDSPAYYIPRITGNLNITAISDGDSTTKILTISSCQSSGGGGGKAVTVQQNVLPYGTFEVLGKEVEWRTAYGALKKASEIMGFSVTPELTDWGIFVKCIKDLCRGDIGETSGWMYWVDYPDKPMPGVAATDYRIYPGDEIVWYFSRSMSDSPESSPYRIYISIGDNYDISVSMVWPSKVPPVADFTYSPSNPIAGEEVIFNASNSVDDGQITDYIWNFGDGKGARGVTVTHVYTNPGSYKVTLTVYDNDGLSDTITKEINVSQPGIFVNTTNQTIVIQPGKVKIVLSDNVTENLSITGLTLESENAARVTISKAHAPPGIIYGTFYRCFEIKANESLKARIDFRVPKDAAEGRNVVLMKYNGSWFELPTKKTGEDSDYIYYSAETRSFSVFAITIKWNDFPLNSSNVSIQKALKWLRSIQNSDGGFANPGENSSVAKTAWAIMAIVAAHQDPHKWTKNGKSPIDFMRERLKKEVDTMGTEDYARTILALVYAGENPKNFAGIDLVGKLKSSIKDNGQIGDFVYKTIWGILALTSVGENVSKSAEWLKAQQNPDGGFSWKVGGKSDFDDTAAAIEALIAAGEPKDSECIIKALKYLKEGQNDDGGMRYFGSSASNAASDAWTIQALVAAGVNPAEWKKNNISVVDHLLKLQTEEGYFRYTEYQTSNPGYMTVNAIMALLGKPHPIRINASIATTTAPTPTVTTTAPETTQTPTVKTTTQAVQTVTTETKPTPGFSVISAIMAIAAITAFGAIGGRKR